MAEPTTICTAIDLIKSLNPLLTFSAGAAAAVIAAYLQGRYTKSTEDRRRLDDEKKVSEARLEVLYDHVETVIFYCSKFITLVSIVLGEGPKPTEDLLKHQLDRIQEDYSNVYSAVKSISRIVDFLLS